MKLRGIAQNRIWGSLLMFLLTIALCAGVSYAWLATYYETEQPVSFDTGTTSAIPVHMWIYDTAEEGTPGWREYWASASGGEDETAILTCNLEKTEDGETAYQYDIRAMHLGSIHDLISVTEDNTVYFRFDIDGTVHGTDMTLQHSFREISGYNRTGQKLSQEILESLTELEGRTPHFRYEYAVSDTACTPSEAEIRSLSWREIPPLEDENGEKHYLVKEQLSADEYSGSYYLYLRVYPDLNTLLQTALILSAQMPSQLFFDISMELEVHPTARP